MMLLFECLNSMCKDSANPWTANCAVDKGTRVPRSLDPLERPATDDRIVMWPLLARRIHGRTESNNYERNDIDYYIEIFLYQDIYWKYTHPKVTDD